MRIIYKCRDCSARIYVAPGATDATTGEELLERLRAEAPRDQSYIHQCNSKHSEFSHYGIADLIGVTEEDISKRGLRDG